MDIVLRQRRTSTGVPCVTCSFKTSNDVNRSVVNSSVRRKRVSVNPVFYLDSTYGWNVLEAWQEFCEPSFTVFSGTHSKRTEKIPYQILQLGRYHCDYWKWVYFNCPENCEAFQSKVVLYSVHLQVTGKWCAATKLQQKVASLTVKPLLSVINRLRSPMAYRLIDRNSAHTGAVYKLKQTSSVTDSRC